MTQPLAKVLGELDGVRGADVVHRVSVPAAWLRDTGCLSITLPRNLSCAECEGGGCDKCSRSGAVSLREKEQAAEVLRVALPLQQVRGSDVCLRFGAQGGHHEDPTMPRGNLLLIVRISDVPGTGIVLERTELPSARVADTKMMARVALGAVLLCLLFFFMLRISGWA